MEIYAEQGGIQATPADSIIVNLFDDVSVPGGGTGAVDRALNGAIQELIAGGDFSGKAGNIAVLYPRGAIPARRVLVVGLGKRKEFDLEGVRRAAAAGIRRARELKSGPVATIVHGAGIAGLPAGPAAQAVVEGSLLALYRYEAPQQKAEADHEIPSLTLVEYDGGKIPELETGVRAGRAVAAGTILARDLVNSPPNVATPTHLAQTAQHIAEKFNMQITIGDRAWAAERNMGAFLGVAKGAGEEPRFIVLEHHAGRPELDTIVLVGKGITFDTGGISIKPSERMERMKSDMGGGAAVLGAMYATGELDLPLHVIGIVPATENMPDAHAYRPADVVTAGNGKTIEIISTDAEGRLVLADGLVYAAQYQPQAVVDLATLTGAAVVALGEDVAAALFSTDDRLRDRLVAAGNVTQERVWPMPLYDDYLERIKSDVADIKNTGGRLGGLGTSAMFLKQFTSYSWAHLDMAGMVTNDKGHAYSPAGATGFGVRLLVDFLRNWS